MVSKDRHEELDIPVHSGNRTWIFYCIFALKSLKKKSKIKDLQLGARGNVIHIQNVIHDLELKAVQNAQKSSVFHILIIIKDKRNLIFKF